MKIAGIIALCLGLVLSIPVLLAAGYETVAALRGPGGPATALLQFDLTAPSDWITATFEHPSLNPFFVGLEVSRTRPSGTGDPPVREGALEIEITDPAGEVAYSSEVPVDSLGPRATLSTGGVTEVHPKRSGRWTIRGRVVRADPAFAGSVVEVFVNRRSRMEGGEPIRNVVLAGGGVVGIARPVFLLLAGASLLIGSRRK